VACSRPAPTKVHFASGHTFVVVKEDVLVLDLRSLPAIGLHGLRHTHATLLLEEGVDVKTVSERLGHDSVQTALELYGGVTPQMRANAAARFRSVLSKARVAPAGSTYRRELTGRTAASDAAAPGRARGHSARPSGRALKKAVPASHDESPWASVDKLHKWTCHERGQSTTPGTSGR
jgi:hypothetical protein